MTITALDTLDTSEVTTELAEELAAVAHRLRRCTVQVRSRRLGGGSGVIWHSDGLIVTNAHVAPRESATVELEDGRVFEAVRTGIDPRQDLAALRVEATDLPAATIGDSEALRVGELVLAMGNPLGIVGALTTGIIHAVSNQKWVMADVRLAPGNSGGLLADARGRVIGINTMIADALALAVPSKAVERFLCGSNRPDLGVTMRPVQVLLENKGVLGLLILSVRSGSAADEAGFQIGDVLIGVFGQSFNTPDDLTSVLWHAQAGDLLPLEFLRSGKRDRRNVVVGGGKDVAGKSFTGVKSA